MTCEDYYASQPGDKRQLLLSLRDVILATLPDAEEHYCMNSPQFRVSGKDILYLANVAAGYVTLGFLYGAHIEDPYGLIEGTGKNLRHIKVRSLEQARDARIQELLRRAQAVGPRRKSTE